AEEHLLRSKGEPRLPKPPHWGPGKLRDPTLLPGGDRTLLPALRRTAGAGGLRLAPRVPFHQVRPGAGGGGDLGRGSAAPPRPRGELPGGQRAAGRRTRHWGDLGRDRLRYRWR